MAPGADTGTATAEQGLAELRPFIEGLDERLSIDEMWRAAKSAGISPCCLAALDIALWDLHGKELGVPIWRVLGLSPRLTPTSLTLGINPPEVIREQLPEILSRTKPRALKVKLGNRAGIEADQASFTTVLEIVKGQGLTLRVDANGGWSLDDARTMMGWLAARGVEFVEQPLKKGEEGSLPSLFKGRALPIFLDESCHSSADIPALADRTDGIVVKLMKCGGISEALRVIATARAHGLRTMAGCMGETGIAISAAASLGSLFDLLDLDSHLNLLPDPTEGLAYRDGVLELSDQPGHGVMLVDS
jgi:muconate cycloisomerase